MQQPNVAKVVNHIADDPAAEESEAFMSKRFAQRRSEGKLSLPHDEVHVMAVARNGAAIAFSIAESIGMDRGFMMVVAPLTYVAGLWHDMVREAKETEPHGPASAKEFLEWRKKGIVYIYKTHADIIADAIASHEKTFADALAHFGDPVNVHSSILKLDEPHCQKSIMEWESLMRSIVGISLKIADGCLEASGYRVVERRCFFVGRERMLHGDLKGILKHPEESDLAVIGESLVRLYGRLAIADYPSWLRPLGEAFHAVQYKFLAGLLTSHNWDERAAAKELHARAFPKLDEGLIATIGEQMHLSGNWFKPEEYPTLWKTIANIKGMELADRKKLALAARMVVRCIAEAETPEKGIDRLAEETEADDCDNEFLGEFCRGIVGYRNSGDEFLNNLHQQISSGVALTRK